MRFPALAPPPARETDRRPDRRGRLAVLALLAAIALLLAGCAGPAGHGPWMDRMHRSMWGSDRNPGAAPPTPEPGAAEFLVVTTEFAFTPDRLEVAPNRPLNLRLRNDGALPHDLTIEGTDFSLLAGPGETAIALLPRLDAGEYRIFCSLAGHAEAGMTGTLVVSLTAVS